MQNLLNNLTQVLQYVAIFTFLILTILSLLTKQYNGAGINLALTLLYIFLYLQPIK